MPRTLSDPRLASRWTVVALCAEWCGTCRDYRLAFELRASRRADARHVWVDIEDDADWLGDLDVETFPTLLVLEEGEPRFYGPVLPSVDVIDRTMRSLARDGHARALIPISQRDAVERLIVRIAGGK